MHVYYTIEYHPYNKYWVVWENSKFERGTHFRGIFRGTKKECKEFLEELKENEKEKIKAKERSSIYTIINRNNNN